MTATQLGVAGLLALIFGAAIMVLSYLIVGAASWCLDRWYDWREARQVFANVNAWKRARGQ